MLFLERVRPSFGKSALDQSIWYHEFLTLWNKFCLILNGFLSLPWTFLKIFSHFSCQSKFFCSECFVFLISNAPKLKLDSLKISCYFTYTFLLKKPLKQKPTTNKTVNEKCKGPENLEKCGPEVRCVTMCEEQMLDVRFSEDTAQKKNFSMKYFLSK